MTHEISVGVKLNVTSYSWEYLLSRVRSPPIMALQSTITPWNTRRSHWLHIQYIRYMVMGMYT